MKMGMASRGLELKVNAEIDPDKEAVDESEYEGQLELEPERRPDPYATTVEVRALEHRDTELKSS